MTKNGVGYWLTNWSLVGTLWFRAKLSNLVVAFVLSSIVATGSIASEIDEARNFFRTGDYAACEAIARTQVNRGIWNDIWPRMLIETLLTVGKYQEATTVFEKATERYRDNIRLRLLGARCYRMTDSPEKATAQLDAIESFLSKTQMRFIGAKDLVPLGEFFLMRGEDPKEVLKICYDQAIKVDSKSVEAYLATARMALDKNDSKVASQALAKAVILDDSDPEVFSLLSSAWSNSDPEKATEYLKRSLELNEHYIPSLILLAESKMASEEYEEAMQVLQQVEQVNTVLPKLWALRSVIAHLQGRFSDEDAFRKKALEPWSLNPEVDFTIGKQLANHYRFHESVQHQQLALLMDKDYIPAASQLSQDLLRIGSSEEGWKLVDEIREKDPYDVTIFNLKQLQKKLESYTVIESPGFIIRMDRKEAIVYGKDVVAILSEAREKLAKKYEMKLEEPVFVEIFAKQKEFAIRTLGLPGGEGLLGVCFGRLITANSPAGLSVEYNWRAVLWHEYCHVVTLQKTKNKMPRWLSEGISVYEERQRNPTWGQAMDPLYRDMILGKDFVPISQLSRVFLRPKTPQQLQFAYFESSLAIEFWIEKYGMPALLKLLDDLAIGMSPDEALKRAAGTMDLLDSDFREFAIAKATAFAPNVDFTRPTLGSVLKEAPPVPDASLALIPLQSYWTLRSKCEDLIRSKRWDDALVKANQLKSLFPEDASEDGVYGLLAHIYRESGDNDLEREACVTIVDRTSNSKRTLLRLVELDKQRNDWHAVEAWYGRLHEIQPVDYELQNERARVAEHLNNPKSASEALLACLELEPPDSSNLHFRLATALHEQGEMDKAKRHVLMALEESPRYVEALRLFVELDKQTISHSPRDSPQPKQSQEQAPPNP